MRPTCYPAGSWGESVIRLILGKLLVNLLQVVKRTNTLLLVLPTHAIALSASDFVHKKNIIPPRPSSRTSSSQLRLLGMICVLLAVRRWQVLKRAAVRMGLHQGMYGVSR